MGLFDLLAPFTKDLGVTDESIVPDLSDYLTREEKEKAKRKQREFQKKTEEIASDINPAFGDSLKAIHTTTNKIEDMGNRLEDTINNARDAMSPENWIRELFVDGQEPKTGDHLKVFRGVYTHHGIYIGNGRVIHYLLKNVQSDSLETFADGAKIRIVPSSESPVQFSPQEIVNRARSRLGEDKYNLIFNNCEHFARWCRSGDSLY